MTDFSKYINLDYAASTPMRKCAIEAQAAFDASYLAGVNPNSLHSLGRQAASVLEMCRRIIAKSFGARVRPSEIVFTGGGTEANFIALAGIAEGVRQRKPQRNKILISSIEHDSILDNISHLRSEGFVVELLSVCCDGFVTPAELEKHMGDDVCLVSVMLANNETGAVQPIRELARIAHTHGAYMMCDAIQGYMHIPFDVSDLGVDAMSAAAHKIGGPVNLGALYIKTRTPLHPQVLGGGQEAGRRAGTQDLRSVVGFTAAVESIMASVSAEKDRLMVLADDLYERLCAHKAVNPTIHNVYETDRLPGIVSITVDGFDSEELILKLDAAGFCVSAGSACSSGSLDPSHVLSAMNIPREQALGSLRISFDDRIDSSQLDRFADALLSIIG